MPLATRAINSRRCCSRTNTMTGATKMSKNMNLVHEISQQLRKLTNYDIILTCFNTLYYGNTLSTLGDLKEYTNFPIHYRYRKILSPKDSELKAQIPQDCRHRGHGIASTKRKLCDCWHKNHRIASTKASGLKAQKPQDCRHRGHRIASTKRKLCDCRHKSHRIASTKASGLKAQKPQDCRHKDHMINFWHKDHRIASTSRSRDCSTRITGLPVHMLQSPAQIIPDYYFRNSKIAAQKPQDISTMAATSQHKGRKITRSTLRPQASF